MKMTMNFDGLLIAINELRDIRSDLLITDTAITKVVPTLDGICFYCDNDIIYKYEYDSGHIYRSYKTDWRAGISPTLISKKN